MSVTERIVLLIDMDCFFCQVEEKLEPKLIGKPVAVVQYNEWKGGGIIAVNYVAKNRGVTRHMRGDDAKKKCPDIELVRVPVLRGKANLTKYRDAGKEVANVLLKFTSKLERASVDEAYLDITEEVSTRMPSTKVTVELLKNTHVVGSTLEDFLQNTYDDDLSNYNLRLAIGAVIAEEIRSDVYKETGYKCSAGIAHNKILAKLACGLHKPNQQTILPQDAVEEFFKTVPIHKIHSLGGKFGDTVAEDLGIKTMGELTKFTEKELTQRYDEKSGAWLYNIARGINFEPVTTRLVSKSIGSSKQFPGKSALSDEDTVKFWLRELAAELLERMEKDLEENNRKAKSITVSFTYSTNKKQITGSRVQTLTAYEADKIANDAFNVIKKNCKRPDGSYWINYLGISAAKFQQLKKDMMDIKCFFKTMGPTTTVQKSDINDDASDNCTNTEKTFSNDEKSDEQKEVDVDNLSRYLTIEDSDNNQDNELSVVNSTKIEESNQNGENTDNSNDSINNEVVNILSGEHNNSQLGGESFFGKYFNTYGTNGEVNRAFDTSRHLEEDESSLDEEDTLEYDGNDLLDYYYNQDEDLLDTCTSREPFKENELLEDDQVEICKECGKKIKKSEFISHLDYHFALSIAEQDRIISTNFISLSNPTNVITKSKKGTLRSIKRKSPEVDTNSTIPKYFRQTAEPEDSSNKAGNSSKTEICEQCNVAIPISEFESHLDYHLAKQLHFEINSFKPLTSENLSTNKESDTSGTSKEQRNLKVPSVISFFKQST